MKVEVRNSTDWNDKECYIIEFSIGVQHFKLNYEVEEIERAQWMKNNLETALKSIYNEGVHEAVALCAKMAHVKYLEHGFATVNQESILRVEQTLKK